MQAVRMLVMPLAIWFLLAGPAAGAEPIGMVVGLQGGVQAVSEAGQTRVLAMKSAVFTKDTIRTGPGAKVQILFSDDSLYSQGENGEVVLDRYVYDPARKANNSCFLRIIRGISRVITGRITDLHPEGFTVRTGRATIGIRGCELGFRIDDRFDQVYVVRLPPGKRIRIWLGDAERAGGRLLDLVETGWVRIGDDGQMVRGALSFDDVRDLSQHTTPKHEIEPAPEGGRGEEEQGTDAGTGEGEQGDDGEGATGDDGTGGEVGGEGEASTDGDLTEDASVLADTTVQDTEQGENSLPEEPVVPPPPPRPPPPLTPLAGGGLGGTYANDTAGIFLNRMFVYDQADVWFGADRSWVTLKGGLFDRNGALLNPAQVTLRDIPLEVFGSTTAYDGFRRYQTDPGVWVQVDNLHQFVTRVNLNDPAQSLVWWGYPSTMYTPAGPPPNRVLQYRVDTLFLPETADPSMPPAGVIGGDLRLNTRTGAYVFRGENGTVDFGRLEDLQFYGQGLQGVSFLANDAAVAQDNMLAGKAIAGHRDVTFDRPAPTVGWGWRGYAAGMVTPIDPAGNPVGISSADLFTDDPMRNEGRVMISLDATAYRANIDANINVYRNPGGSTPYLQWGTPTESFYVDGNDFAAFYSQPAQHGALQSFRSGTDWTWGEWEGERQVDLGGGVTGTEKTRGTVVVGRTLSDTEYGALYGGAVPYHLRTPLDRAGEAVAYITRGGYASEIHGTAMLNVDIAGGGGPATWSGQFNMGQSSGGDRLSFSVAPTPISTRGHLQGEPGSDYQLTAGGVDYNSGSLTTQRRLTGSLVGPGPGNPTPITGAIGQGRLVHTDGTQVNMAYGTELQE